jgi:hypothetical protein
MHHTVRVTGQRGVGPSDAAVLNMAVFEINPQSAVEAPRAAGASWHESGLPRTYRPGSLNVDADVGDSAVEGLAALGRRRAAALAEVSRRLGLRDFIRDENGYESDRCRPRRTAYAVG